MLDPEGEPDGEPPRRLLVSPEVEELIADSRMRREDWLAQAETVELVTAAAAVDAGERRLASVLDGAG
jgi:hypothetical protein